MDTLNFIIKDNKELVENILNGKLYTKIGHKKDDCTGVCILIQSKKYFELSSVENKEIHKTSNISDLIHYLKQ